MLLALSPAMIISTALQVKFVAQGTQSQQAIKSKATSLVTDTVSGIRTVLSFVWDPEAIRRYNLLLNEFYEKGKKRSHLQGIGLGLSFMLIFFVYALAFWYGGTLVANGEMQVGDLLIVFFSIIIGAMGLGQATQFNPDFAKARGSASKILDIINKKPEIDVDAPGVKDVKLGGNIIFSDVWFSYPVRKTEGEFSDANFKEKKEDKQVKKEDKKSKKEKKKKGVVIEEKKEESVVIEEKKNVVIEEKKGEEIQAEEEKVNEPILRGLNLEVKTGQIVALVGHSGCGKQKKNLFFSFIINFNGKKGKSTSIALLERFYDIDKGILQIDGKDIKEYNLKWLRSQIGLVSQEPILFNCSVADNIRWGKQDATEKEIEEAAKTANAHDFISNLQNGYNTQVGEKGSQMRF